MRTRFCWSIVEEPFYARYRHAPSTERRDLAAEHHAAMKTNSRDTPMYFCTTMSEPGETTKIPNHLYDQLPIVRHAQLAISRHVKDAQYHTNCSATPSSSLFLVLLSHLQFPSYWITLITLAILMTEQVTLNTFCTCIHLIHNPCQHYV